MKRILLILLMTFSLGMCTLPAYAASAETPPLPSENLDSFHWTEKEKKDFQIKISDTTVRLYNGYYTPFLAEGMSVIEIINQKCVSYEYMIKSVTGRIRYMNYLSDGTPQRILYALQMLDWSDFYRYAANPHLVLDSSIKVNEVYCLNGEPERDGVYIYYVTDQGDYVLYREYLTADAQYLISAQELYSMAKRITENNKQNGDELLYGGSPTIAEICDLSAYQVPFQAEKSAFSWGWVAAGAAGVLVIGGTAIALLCRKKKKASKASQE